MGDVKAATPVAPTPLPQRRPRVREVSSRYMSPLVPPAPTSSSTGDHHHLFTNAKSPSPRPTPFDLPRQHRRSNSVQKQRSSVLHHETDENRPESNIRSSDNLLGYHSMGMTNPPRPVAVRLFKERGVGGGREELQRTRSDTPVVSTLDRATLFRMKRGNNICNLSDSAASKLLQSSGLNGRGSRESSPKSSPVKGSTNTSCSSAISRSVDCGTNKLVRESTDSLNSVEAWCLPPMPPPCSRTGADVKRGGGKKGLLLQDDMHKLKVLHNHHLMWRFANAKAEASISTQKRDSEAQVYSVGLKLLELQASVQEKRAELEYLQRIKALSTIVEAQMPSLDQWSDLEEDYSSALSDTVQRLLNASSQIPLAGNVRADASEIAEVLNSAAKTMDSIFGQVENVVPQAEHIGCSVSELAKLFSGEQGMIQECGVLLSATHYSQIEECSLRGHIIMDLHRQKQHA